MATVEGKDTLTNLGNTTLINCKLFEFFAQHLMLECKVDTHSSNSMQDFLTELAKIVNPDSKMEGVDQDCLVQRYGENDFSVVKIFEKGHITMYVSGERLFLDVFSCKKINIQLVKTHVQKYFFCKMMKETSLDRGI
jgi:hypothetical protein